MKEHLKFDPVENVHVAIAMEKDDDWKVYLLNRGKEEINNILISSRGYGEIDGEKKNTSVLRHHFDTLSPGSALTVEPILPELFQLFNEYWVSYYIDRKIYDKKFVFAPGSFFEENHVDVPIIKLKGILHN